MKDISQSEEGWAKRDGAKPRGESLKFYSAPTKVPVPKRGKSAQRKDENNSSDDIITKGSDPATEAIECCIRAILNSEDTAGHLFLLNHYAIGVILHGTREQMARQGLKSYFKMRRNRLGKEDWDDIKWKPGKIAHNYQEDDRSCGVFVMQMAKMTILDYPDIPTQGMSR
ncbi:hypothetical protein D5F01_LYC11183 [Larimichthys crocea]|uniref:Uncharacterized protein n=1 Tax=Larimichthys crocea TaxID=215358 RepID=A0A6G0IE20_LARCR|nr:hypothetical protein D5F01_LYC11183 [Larimichthys crocea]